MEKRIGFVGAGNMATAIINGVLRNKAKAPEFLEIYDLDEQKCRIMYEKGICCSHSVKELAENCDIIILAVKPQNYEEVLSELKGCVTLDKVFVSIAAGISIDYIRRGLGLDCPMVRVMPNTPLLLGKGATAMCRSENISDEDFNEVYSLFALSGDVAVLPEDKMNAVIAVNGSSPAYVYLFAKAMRDYAVSVGIDERVAMNLICKTLEGSAEMLRSSGDTPDTLIQKVSSKGGTTIEALKVMNDNCMVSTIQQAMAACTRRAEELGR